MPAPDRPAVFLDRDGTVMEDVGYPRDPDTVRLLPGAAEALHELQQAGFALVIVSNQSGIARGIITPAQARAVHERFMALLAAEGVTIDAYRFCPHGPDDGCECRKPSPAMLLDAAHELGIDLGRSSMIGDRPSDIEAGRAAGCATTILITDEDWSQVGARLLAGGDAMSEITDLSGARVLIVGDVMLDEYIWGDVRRISPEAPVPIVEVTRRSHVPGGAANVAAGIVAFGGRSTLVGVIGQDLAGDNLRDSLVAASVDVTGMVVDSARPTTCKTRVIAHAQQVVRTDHELRGPLPGQLAEQLLAGVRERLSEVEAIVLSDYGKGIVSDAAAQAIIAAAAAADTPVIVDPKGLDFGKYRGATLVTPNELELSQAGHVHFDGDESVLQTARRMTAENDVGLLVTRGAAGMLLVADGIEFRVPARARDVYDVTGAGDTVVSMLAVALGRRLDLRRAVELANEAAGIAVGKIGTSTVSLEELEHWLAG